VTIEWQDPKWLGKTSWKRKENGKHQIATAVNSERFFRHYLSVVGAKNH
jgi:hypothetical protein